MTGSIERIWRRVARQPLVPAMVITLGIHVPVDPTHRNTGYGGVLPIPSTASALATRPDSFVEHRDLRATRGRVLYARGHAPQSEASAVHIDRKTPCAARRVVQARTASAPNS
jgi:hypothetical protein